MQGRQNMANLERKGPHKSMHCKFCKPPGVEKLTPEKLTRAQMETKTKIHLAHEAADLRVCNIHNEPGFPTVESEACVCVLEGENACPKCIPDKNKPPPKKKVCRCPKGAKAHPTMFNETTPKKKKKVEEDDEFWWEKYSREHDALAKETWAAYMAQRRKDKKLEKCQKREKMALAKMHSSGTPNWFERLSCQQIIYVEYLSTAIRLDSDENITDRTNFVLGGIGLYPRPKKKVLKKCLKYCHYNSIQFLSQLHVLVKDEDPFQEKRGKNVQLLFTWNEKLIMNSLCHLEFPSFLREIMDRLPPLPKAKPLPQIPYPTYQVAPKKKFDNPYEEPIWQDRINWVDKERIDRLNRVRIHMESKRIKLPPLALVRRPSLIDARPPFLAQIEANERASRILVKEKRRKLQRKKHPISTFNSAIDVTAIAGIEASEISTTDKADTDDICVFLREPKEGESVEGEGGEIQGEMDEEEPDFKEVKFLEEPPKVETQMDKMSTRELSETEDQSEAGEQTEDIPFKTPPKTQSGRTIQSPCPPPNTTPGPPAEHYDIAKRELGIVNEEICGFFPFVSSSTQTNKGSVCDGMKDVEFNLKSAAAKLKKLAHGDEGEEKPVKKRKKKGKKKDKCKCPPPKRKSIKSATTKRRGSSGSHSSGRQTAGSIQTEDGKPVEEEEEEEEEGGEEEEEGDGMQISFKIQTGRERLKSQVESEESDPDPESEDEWSMRPPCLSDGDKFDSDEKPSETAMARVIKRKKGKHGRKKSKKKKGKRVLRLEEETGLYRKKKGTGAHGEKETEGKEVGKEEKKEEKDSKVELYTGDVVPLVNEIIKDLAEEGFNCAAYPLINKHPDVQQLIQHLKGEILTRQLRSVLRAATKMKWSQMKGARKFPVSELGINAKRAERANWNDKKWISQMAKKKIDQFYYKVASDRAQYAVDFGNTLSLSYFGTERYQKIFYAYMLPRYQDAILRGIF